MTALDLVATLARELDLRPWQVENALALLDEGATVPFVARYRKERTGSLDEVQLRALSDRRDYLSALRDRQAAILKSIAEQGKLTDDLRAKIQACTQKTDLEDLYLPYRPKRRTRAAAAREKGLDPLAAWIAARNRPDAAPGSLDAEATRYVNPDRGVPDPDAALKGAADILAEAIAEQADLRADLRSHLTRQGAIAARIKGDLPEGSTQFETYRNFRAPVRTIAPHQLLAILRGEREKVLSLALEFDEDRVLADLEQREIRTRDRPLRKFYQAVVKDAFARLLKPSLTSAIVAEAKERADRASVDTFAANLRDLLLAAPAGMKPVLGIDPGFRTGCKVAALDATGKFLEYQTLFPHGSAKQRQEAARTLAALIRRHAIDLIAIGNGTASRETDRFVGEVLADLDRQPIKAIVSEAGASVYSASPLAAAEFPDLDLTARGAISIGRRLQDPLAELVKIDPKSIGVGQYQHDVDPKLLKQKLDETVESCTNYVGVDLNTASKELLAFVSGLSPAVANNIVSYRNDRGAFRDRRELLKVPKLGPKAFEQAAGFLRIRNGKTPLDNTAVHPERYDLVAAIARDANLSPAELAGHSDRLRAIDLKRYVTDTVGEPTLRDILAELEKPGRDPRDAFVYANFRDDIQDLRDLKPGLILEGVVTNVANFGAFVDVGVHQDGLVHISQLADRFVKDPKEIVKVGQVVKVKVLDVNEKLKRIGLSIKAVSGGNS